MVSVPAHRIHYTWDEYVAFEATSNVKHEYLDGQNRGDKLEHYKRIPSLEQYVLVSHREPMVEVWTRGEGEAWGSRVARAGEIAPLDAVGAKLDVRELYEAAAEPRA